MLGTRQSASFLNRSRAMTHTSQDISPLRQRMIDDMRMRKLAPKTQAGYVRVVRQFTAFLGRPPDTAAVEDLRRYQLHLVDHGISPVSLNAAITGLKFFFEITLNQPELMARMQPVRVPRTLPVVLSPDEVARLIAAAGNLNAVNRVERSKHMTTLQEKLDAFKTDFEAGKPPYSVPRSVTETMHRATKELIASGAALRALKAGDKAPSVRLKDPEGNSVSPASLLAHSPLVVSCSRGVWCPNCNMELQA